MDAVALGALVVALGGLMLVDLFFFARGREAALREAVTWSVAWLVLSLAAGLVVWALSDGDRAITYTTVYLIERSLSLDNLFVFLMLYAYFSVPQHLRARLLFWGIVAALLMRGAAIVVGVALIEEFEVVLYILGAGLLVLAWKMFKGVGDSVEPESTVLVRAVKRLFPVTEGYRDRHWFAREDGRLHTTPLFICLISIVMADIAFAIDSIPAAFAITQDSFVIWMANGFALLGLRALFVLVEGLRRHVRYLDETIAVVLAIVAAKLLLKDVIHLSPVASLALVLACFAVGTLVSLRADRRDETAAA
jgi:tellurite resistance protein TerC